MGQHAHVATAVARAAADRRPGRHPRRLCSLALVLALAVAAALIARRPLQALVRRGPQPRLACQVRLPRLPRLRLDTRPVAVSECPAVDGIFALNRAAAVPTDTTRDLFFMPLAMYGIWWLCYGAWLLSIGHSAPERGWGDSSFKDNRPTITKLFGIPQSQPRKQACAYLLTHLTAVSLIFCVIPPLMYHS